MRQGWVVAIGQHAQPRRLMDRQQVLIGEENLGKASGATVLGSPTAWSPG